MNYNLLEIFRKFECGPVPVEDDGHAGHCVVQFRTGDLDCGKVPV